MIVVSVGALLGAAVLGFAAGLFSFRVKARWCPIHGVVKDCAACRKVARVAAPERAGWLLNSDRSARS